MAEISIWKAIKACIIILLIIVVLKKILQVFGDHKARMASIEKGNFTSLKHQQKKEMIETLGNVGNNAVGTILNSDGYQNITYPTGMAGGADEDVPDPEDIGYDGEYSGSEDISMGGGSFFDILSKVKKVATKKKKAAKKAVSNKKATKKTSSKKKGKK